jgi:hypothetical protein
MSTSELLADVDAEADGAAEADAGTATDPTGAALPVAQPASKEIASAARTADRGIFTARTLPAATCRGDDGVVRFPEINPS